AEQEGHAFDLMRKQPVTERNGFAIGAIRVVRLQAEQLRKGRRLRVELFAVRRDRAYGIHRFVLSMCSAGRNRIRPIAHGSRRGLAGWSTVASPLLGNRTTVWRAGHGAGALTALFMLAAGRALPGFRAGNEKARRLSV